MNSLDKYSEKEWNKYISHNSGMSIRDMMVIDEKRCEDINCENCDCDLKTEIGNEAQERKNTPVFSGVLKYFPNALKEVSKCSQAGNDQHPPDKPLHWDMDKSKDEYDALTRHLIDHTINPIDTDGILHLTKVAWRALAGLERHLTNKK